MGLATTRQLAWEVAFWSTCCKYAVISLHKARKKRGRTGEEGHALDFGQLATCVVSAMSPETTCSDHPCARSKPQSAR